MSTRLLFCFLGACVVVLGMLLFGTRYFMNQKQQPLFPLPQEVEVQYLTPQEARPFQRDNVVEPLPRTNSENPD